METRASTSQVVNADLRTVMDLCAYENIPKWSKKFRTLEVLERNGDAVKARVETTVMGIRLSALVSGRWEGDRVIEEIHISDGTVTSEVVVFSPVSSGTLVEWTGRIVSLGRWTRLLGPLMGRFFEMDVRRDFRQLAKYAESVPPPAP